MYSTGNSPGPLRGDGRARSSTKEWNMEMKPVCTKKGLLLLRVIVVLIIGGFGGWFVHSQGLLQTSFLGRISQTIGIPLVPVGIEFAAILIAYVMIADSWNCRIDFMPDHLLIRDHFGISKISYDNIESTKVVAYGAGIKLKNPADWLNSFQGSESRHAKLIKSSGVLKAVYGCDLCIKKICLDIRPERFLQQVNEHLADRAKVSG
jgi:hypothetical protein